MVAEDLLFWLAPLTAGHDDQVAVLCRRHADSMVLPRGWVLDDRREATPRLFRSPPSDGGERVRRAHRRRVDTRDDSGGIQLSLTEPSREVPVGITDADGAHAPVDETPADTSGPVTALWSPLGDLDDLDDVLPQVDSPLLSRAFRGINRQRP